MKRVNERAYEEIRMGQKRKEVICIDNKEHLYLVIVINDIEEEQKYDRIVCEDVQKVFKYSKDNLNISEYLIKTSIWREENDKYLF